MVQERYRRFLGLLICLFISLILQTTIFPLVQIRGIMPNLLLILVVLTGLFYGSYTGAAVGFGIGLIQDLISCRYLGLGAYSGLLTGYLMGHLEGSVYKENPFVPLILVGLGSLLFNGVFTLGQEICGASAYPISILWKMLLPEAFYNMVLTAVLYRPLLKLLFPVKANPEIQKHSRFFR